MDGYVVAPREFWFNFMSDQAGPPAGEGVGGGASSFCGNLTEPGFIAHRRMIEPEHPLEADLLSMGLDILPEYLQRWQVAKVRKSLA